MRLASWLSGSRLSAASRRLERLDRLVLARVEPGQLGAQLGGVRLERDRLLVRGNRVVEPAQPLEMAPEKK